ncbi:hypothetical protein DPMN_125779 [Dreissena polymorpha]|uniref:Uncharacterized protein n=1 Tax=Dreissena polymorpha TaxID=45954 RepID=A0A9D4JV11_DREPO|nr:hypothetical protein DPMN_125779 [Dreissena polymorpha]
MFGGRCSGEMPVSSRLYMQSGLSCSPYPAIASSRFSKYLSTSYGVVCLALFESNAEGFGVDILLSRLFKTPYSQQLLRGLSVARFPRWCANSPAICCMAVLLKPYPSLTESSACSTNLSFSSSVKTVSVVKLFGFTRPLIRSRNVWFGMLY